MAFGNEPVLGAEARASGGALTGGGGTASRGNDVAVVGAGGAEGRASGAEVGGAGTDGAAVANTNGSALGFAANGSGVEGRGAKGSDALGSGGSAFGNVPVVGRGGADGSGSSEDAAVNDGADGGGARGPPPKIGADGRGGAAVGGGRAGGVGITTPFFQVSCIAQPRHWVVASGGPVTTSLGSGSSHSGQDGASVMPIAVNRKTRQQPATSSVTPVTKFALEAYAPPPTHTTVDSARGHRFSDRRGLRQQ